MECDASVFNPLDKFNLGKSISSAIMDRPALELKKMKSFIGAGIYVLYYKGPNPIYKPISQVNKHIFTWPVYVGKAVPAGARKGSIILDSLSGNDLYKRLCEHRKSIEEVSNLDINDFFYRYLLVDDIWIPLGESVLIQQTLPIWNAAIDGFGNHAPGNGRNKQSRSPWDMLHPGRPWATSLPEGKQINEIEEIIRTYYCDMKYNDAKRAETYI